MTKPAAKRAAHRADRMLAQVSITLVVTPHRTQLRLSPFRQFCLPRPEITKPKQETKHEKNTPSLIGVQRSKRPLCHVCLKLTNLIPPIVADVHRSFHPEDDPRMAGDNCFMFFQFRLKAIHQEDFQSTFVSATVLPWD